jgi:hypothetical protein
MNERWLPVPGYEGLYEISSLGKLRSFPRQTRAGILGGKPIAGSKDEDGYIRATFSRDGKATRMYVHDVVLLAFIGPAPAGHEARHLNGHPAENDLGNLTWGTRSENAFDRTRHGTNVNRKGELHPMTSLRNEDAMEIIRMKQRGMKQRDIALIYRIGEATVSRIVNAKGWLHLNRGAE